MPEDDGSCLRESEGRAGRAARAKAERPTSMLCKMNHKQSCFDEVQSKGREQPEIRQGGQAEASYNLCITH